MLTPVDSKETISLFAGYVRKGPVCAVHSLEKKKVPIFIKNETHCAWPDKKKEQTTDV